MLIDLVYIGMIFFVVLMCLIIWIGYVYLDNKLRYNKGHCRNCQNHLDLVSIDQRGICHFKCNTCNKEENILVCVVTTEKYKWSKLNGK